MARVHEQTLKRMANDFLIWRAGNSVKWDCTAQDIADETGLSSVTVRAACNRRGWSVIPPDYSYDTRANMVEVLAGRSAREGRLRGMIETE